MEEMNLDQFIKYLEGLRGVQGGNLNIVVKFHPELNAGNNHGHNSLLIVLVMMEELFICNVHNNRRNE